MSYPIMSTTVPWSLVKSGFKKTPHFNSVVQKSAAGRGRSSFSLQPYPTWDFELDLNMILGGEGVSGSVLQSFIGCFIACAGGCGPFLFTDPNDNAVTLTSGIALNVTPGAGAPMGQAGDGTSTQFQLARSVGQGVDILQNVSSVLVSLDGGTPVAAPVSATGVVTFGTPPTLAESITWQGAFQYLCQFTDDTLKDLAQVSKNASGLLWSCSSIAFESFFV